MHLRTTRLRTTHFRTTLHHPIVQILLAAALMAGTVPQTHAQDRHDTLTYRYPGEVIITGTRINMALPDVPFGTRIIGADVLGRLPRAVGFDEVLELAPGVKIDNQANGSRIHLSIRGQGILTERGIRGIRILQDGLPFNDPTGFAPDAFDAQYDALSRIEVLRGPAASLYGGSASGGIINLVTHDAPAQPLFGEAATMFGSHNFWRGGGRFGGSTDDVGYWIGFSRGLGDGYRQHTHFHQNSVYGKAVYTPSPSLQITPIVSWTDTYHENPEGISLAQYQQDDTQPNPDAIPFNEYLETNRSTIGATAVQRIADRHELRLTAFTRRTLFTEANNHTFTHRTLNTPGASLQFNLQCGDQHAFLRNTISVGTDAQWQDIDEYRTDNFHAVEGDTVRSREHIMQSGIGVFVIDKLDLGEHWSVLGSVRYDRITNELDDRLQDPVDLSGTADFSRVTGRLGLTWRPFEKISVYTSWGQGFLPPATEELAQNPDHYGGFNTHLVPALSNSIELGTRGAIVPELEHDLALFALSTDNDFDRYRITDPLRAQETFYRNAGSSERYGIETWLRWHPARSLVLQAAYTWSHFRYTTGTPIRIMMDDPSVVKYITDGNTLPNSPEHQLVFDAEYHVLPSLSVGATAQTMSKAYIDGANIEAEAVAGYTLVHARVRWSWHIDGVSGELSLAVRNIGDTKYVAFSEPDPGGNSYQPGARREGFGGIKLFL